LAMIGRVLQQRRGQHFFIDLHQEKTNE